MHYLKALGFLFLVLLTNPAFAFSSSPQNDFITEPGISAEITGDIQEISPAILTTLAVFSEEIDFFEVSFNFYFQSSYEAVLANKYIALSRTIDPSLDIRELIFPFHFFP